MPPPAPLTSFAGQDFFSPYVWTGFVRDLPIPADFIGYNYLPSRDVPGDKLTWDVLKAELELARFVAPDAESPRMQGMIMSSAWAEVSYLRYKRSYNESDLRVIRDFGMAPQNNLGASMRDAAESQIARDVQRLNDAIDARIEWMQVKALLGLIQTPPDTRSDISFTLTYPVVQVTPTTLWSDTANSDPINDIQTWYLDQRFAPAVAIMPRQVFYNIERNVHMIRQFGFGAGVVAGNAPSLIVPGDVQRVWSDLLGIQIVLYNNFYTTRPAGPPNAPVPPTLNRILPNNKVIFLPSENVGYTATSPAIQNRWAAGKYSWVRSGDTDGAARDPWLYEMGVGWNGLPVIERPERIFVATVG